MKRYMKHLVFGLALVAILLSAGIARANKPSILFVDRHVDYVDVKAPVRHKSRRLPKFLDVQPRRKAVSETYLVTWDPGTNPLPRGVTISFYFRQSKKAKPGSLHIKYPFVVDTARNAEFIIPENVLVAKGAVTAWKAVLRNGKRIIAQRSSPLWNKR